VLLKALRNGILGVLATLLFVEALLRVLPVSSATMTGYRFDPEILVYPPHHEWQMATGWDLRNPQHLRSNNAGFAAERDFLPNPDAVALVGDSYVEASMLAAADRPAVQFERALAGTRPVYGLGGPGSSLLDYAERVRYASVQWHVRDIVLLIEAGDLRQSFCGSTNVHSACLDRATLEPRRERFRDPDGLKRMLRHSMLAQYFFAQIKLNGARLREETFTRKTPQTMAALKQPGARHPALPPETIDVVLGHFLERVQPYRPGRRLVAIVDGRRTGPVPQPQPQDFERMHLMRRLREAGITVVDAEAIYGRHLAQSPLSVEVGPYDPHLNAIGVRLLLEAAAAVLQGPR
jgi:hypothetical protein